MDTMLTFDTPTIDAQIAQLQNGDRRAAQFQQAKDILTSALAAGSIYNVDFKDAKESISRVTSNVLSSLYRAYCDNHRDLRSTLTADVYSEVYDAVNMSVQINYAAGLAKRTEKLVKQGITAVAPFLGVYREVAQFAEAINELKGHVVMGRKPLENPKPVDMSNTGTCAICQHTQKLTGNVSLVAHGYTISDGHGNYFGFQNGKCFGVGYSPYETSCHANYNYVAALNGKVASTEKRIASLKAGEIPELDRMETRRERGRKITELKTYRVGDDIFPDLLGHELASAHYMLDAFRCEIERQELLIKVWAAKPLPGK
jgi:hypothetical protein